ncbi:hypothetical protein [Synechococcus sp. WH 8016]|uniref:hypothetical protein n=1 Tax=Synechococcus sp. WH 8016 TaxID=166318 RepID=UPI001145660C|nr:hypothetical protein [Synechococcus sp. WH 8016]
MHHEHGDTEVYRDGHSHACLACIENIESSKLSFNLDRLKPEHRKQAQSFWSKVNIASLDDCWQWTAPNVPKMGVAFYWKRPPIRKVFKFHAVHVASWLTWGDIGRHEIISLCGQRRCVNPLHQIPLTPSGIGIIDDIDMTSLSKDLEILKQQLTSAAQHNLFSPSIEEQIRQDPNANRYMSKYRQALDDVADRYELALYERNEHIYNSTLELI